ncbi:type IV toxin-antitoxin system AbiEi family antitoxin domain-containing protein [Amycolatopsis sp., V23-08]|uniref:Type IV toxin-antitoxin system AbiEi family antitoxin domain-containing protein n=1 Tax=Amycolatopsis heterodermiae TaxID=3110235 RepID=A0ABU5R7M8_9PSEU|nr:type IV toxin-antitoxin system AbiEi family antitoxin domain-containing protein [Amycolatopsis sp., V23-08]MEA5362235.1 type IV toxin-antitoxin system AbiEi family antitoxin domain-containing protein [Amycolatopsis sp., V23-08]
MPLHRRWSTDELPEPARPSWQVVLEQQSGIFSLGQLRAYGHTKADLTANVEAGRWQRVLPGVYATFTGPLPRPARMAAALLYGGKHAILSHHSAAEEWGLVPITDRPVEITVPYTSSAISQPPLVVVHRSRALAHTTLAVTPPRTRGPDTVLDLAVSQETAREATLLIVDLVSRGPISLEAVENCVTQRPPYRYRAAIRRGFGLVRNGLMSALEVEYLQLVEDEHGLPRGDRQTPFVVDGKTLWEDVTYDSHGAAVTVRLDGRATHAVAGVAFRDRRRDNAAELAGRARLVYGWNEVHTKPCTVADEVRQVLLREGWDPTGHREPTCERCMS